MLKNLLRIPDTFDPNDRRRRQVLNILLIVFTTLTLLVIILSLLVIYYHLDPHGSADEKSYLFSSILFIVINILLLIANRSPKIPGWLTAMIFVTLIIISLTQADTSEQLYNGRSLIFWVFPIMIAAIIWRPAYTFMIAALISGLIWLFSHNANGTANYFSIIGLFAVAFVCWLGMSIANRAISDARRHAASLEAILNSIADGVLVLNPQGNFISANPALLRMVPENELREIIFKPLEKTIQWKHKVFTVTASPVPGVGSVAIFRDETRRHETERARDSLLATVSHEFRTPLAAVMNYLEMLLMLNQMGKTNSEAFNQHLARALDNSRRLHELVSNILDQAQIQAGVLELKQQLFNLPALLEKSRQLLDVLLKQKDLSYELTIARNVPTEITGDPERLHQVLINLIGNAIKFTNQGGIKVKVSLPQEETLSIEVVDTGPGIPEEQLPDIFEAFRRSSNYVHRERQGAGLGLSISKEIVTLMGGEISVSSALGVGSAFTIWLPYSRV
jgi:signal transduction histidine kinase